MDSTVERIKRAEGTWHEGWDDKYDEGNLDPATVFRCVRVSRVASFPSSSSAADPSRVGVDAGTAPTRSATHDPESPSLLLPPLNRISIKPPPRRYSPHHLVCTPARPCCFRAVSLRCWTSSPHGRSPAQSSPAWSRSRAGRASLKRLDRCPPGETDPSERNRHIDYPEFQLDKQDRRPPLKRARQRTARERGMWLSRQKVSVEPSPSRTLSLLSLLVLPVPPPNFPGLEPLTPSTSTPPGPPAAASTRHPSAALTDPTQSSPLLLLTALVDASGASPSPPSSAPAGWPLPLAAAARSASRRA